MRRPTGTATSVTGYAGYSPGQQPYNVGGQPWAMPATAQPPGQIGPHQGLGDWGSDPFGYTGGSMLTPWTQPLPNLPSGGYAAAELTPWSYGDISYGFNVPAGYNASQFAAPDKFTHYNREALGDFKAPAWEALQQDPGYQARMAAGTEAIDRSAARGGTLRSGGTLRGLTEFGQNLGTQEYEKMYGRAASEYDRRLAEHRNLYDVNRANVAENYDRNFRTQFDVHNANEAARLNAYRASTDAYLGGHQLGWDITQGTYDRNRQNAMDTWQSEQAMAQAAAAAANAGNERDYQRAMQQYGLAYDIFQNNQSNQWNRLNQMAGMGMNAAGQQGAYGANYAANMGNLYTGAGNAAAAGHIAGGNAWGNAGAGIANTAMDLYAMHRFGSQPQVQPPGGSGYLLPGSYVPAPTPPRR